MLSMLYIVIINTSNNVDGIKNYTYLFFPYPHLFYNINIQFFIIIFFIIIITIVIIIIVIVIFIFYITIVIIIIDGDFKILGLNPKDPQDWITAGLSVVITVTGFDIVSSLVLRLISQLSTTPMITP